MSISDGNHLDAMMSPCNIQLAQLNVVTLSFGTVMMNPAYRRVLMLIHFFLFDVVLKDMVQVFTINLTIVMLKLTWTNISK